MTLKHVKNMDMIKLSVGFHSIFIRTQKIIIKHFFFHHFCKLKIDLIIIRMETCLHGKKNEIENIINKFVYKFNKNNKYGDEWDHFQKQVIYKNE